MENKISDLFLEGIKGETYNYGNYWDCLYIYLNEDVRAIISENLDFNKLHKEILGGRKYEFITDNTLGTLEWRVSFDILWYSIQLEQLILNKINEE